MTTYYHGTDRPIDTLRSGSYVTRHFKDAEKFGYRRAVASGSATVHLYAVDVLPEQTTPDPRRDRAFLVTSHRPVRYLSEVPTFAVEHKLAKFRREKP
jgi:hypothetical protein